MRFTHILSTAECGFPGSSQLYPNDTNSRQDAERGPHPLLPSTVSEGRTVIVHNYGWPHELCRVLFRRLPRDQLA